MTGFVLLENYVGNLEALLRKNRSRAASSSATPLTNKPVALAPSATPAMAMSLCDYSIPAIANVPVGPAANTGT